MSNAESPFQAFDEILGGRLGKKNVSPSPQPTGGAGQLYENATLDEGEKTSSQESSKDDEDHDIELDGSLQLYYPVAPPPAEDIVSVRSVDPDTGLTSLSWSIKSPKLQGVIRSLKTPVAHHSARSLEEK